MVWGGFYSDTELGNANIFADANGIYSTGAVKLRVFPHPNASLDDCASFAWSDMPKRIEGSDIKQGYAICASDGAKDVAVYEVLEMPTIDRHYYEVRAIGWWHTY